jgi:Family of unknown function (DUF6152)
MLLALGAVGILVGAGRSGAAVHHGWANYDSSDTLDLTGAIREVEYENPHVLIRLETSGDSAQRWLAVLAPPARMQRRGLPADSLRVGMQARVVGYPHREVVDEMRAERIIIGDKTTELR